LRKSLGCSPAPYLEALDEISACCRQIAAADAMAVVHVCREHRSNSAFFRVHGEKDACNPLVRMVSFVPAVTQLCSTCAPWTNHRDARKAYEYNLKMANDPSESHANRALYRSTAQQQQLRASLEGAATQARMRMLTLILGARRSRARHLPDELWLMVQDDITQSQK
jgi:hypothetical protein